MALLDKTRVQLEQLFKEIKHYLFLCSGCGSVGLAVNSNTRGLRFEASHAANLFTINCNKTVLKKQKLSKKRLEIAQCFKEAIKISSFKQVLGNSLQLFAFLSS